jgi:hypothetical protein
MSTVMITHIPSRKSSIPPFPVYPIAVRQYHDMINLGILTEDDEVNEIDPKSNC